MHTCMKTQNTNYADTLTSTLVFCVDGVATLGHSHRSTICHLFKKAGLAGFEMVIC